MKYIVLSLLSMGSIFNVCNPSHSVTEKGEVKVPQRPIELPEKNKLVVSVVTKYGPEISSTYEKAVCKELVIKVLEKIIPLTKTDKKRIRIITDENIYELIAAGSEIPKGVCYALTAKGVGEPIDDITKVMEGDFVQFWTMFYGHCGIIKSIDLENNIMEMYSSNPSTNGYGIQKFYIPSYVYFVRLK